MSAGASRSAPGRAARPASRAPARRWRTRSRTQRGQPAGRRALTRRPHCLAAAPRLLGVPQPRASRRSAVKAFRKKYKKDEALREKWKAMGSSTRDEATAAYEGSDEFLEAWKLEAKELITAMAWQKRKMEKRLKDEEDKVKIEEQKTREEFKRKRQENKVRACARAGARGKILGGQGARARSCGHD